MIFLKRNVFLRAAAYLLAAVIASMSLLPGALAKYIAAVVPAGASARVAKFSFQVGSVKSQTPAAGPFDDARDTDRYGNPLVVEDGETWNEIAVTAGASLEFEAPVFAFAYLGYNNAVMGPAGTITAGQTTVLGRDSAIVAAPGTGYLFGTELNKPNYAPDQLGYSGINYFDFRNDSEVAVRFRLSIDNESQSADARDIPFVVLDPRRSWSSLKGNGPIVLTFAYDVAANPIYSTVDAFWDWEQNVASCPANEWISLKPGQGCTFGFVWIWPFAYESNNHSGMWTVHDTAALSAGNFDNERDSRLGMKAAQYLKGGAGAPALEDVTIKLALKLEVEQVN